MAIPDFIRQRGFRTWYERELLRGHSHLVLLVLCTLAAIGALEAFSQQQGGQRLLMAACVLLAGAIGAWAIRRYLFHLMRAEFIANQAVCPQCKAYGRWRVEQVDGGDEASERPPRMWVCCRACSQHWTIEW